MTHRIAASLLVLVACQEPAGTPPDGGGPTTDPTDGTPPTDTSHTGGTTDTATTGTTGDTATITAVVDCATNVSPSPLSTTPVPNAHAYHDVLFDDDGNVIGSDNNNLIRVDYNGNGGVMVPNTGLVQGLGALADGDFVGATDDSDSLFRFTDAGASSLILGSSGAYGVIVGPDGMIYTANYNVIERVDPATGQRTELYRHPQGDLEPKSINWNRDHTKMFVGTGFGNGNVYALDIDPVTLDPIGDIYVFAENVGTGTYHDCLAVDYCDNVYVCDFNTSSLYRISPDGQVSTYIDFGGSDGQYSHGAEWGSGIGGFRVDALYIAQPYNGNSIAEVVVGIPGRAWDGTGWTPSYP